MTIGPEPIIRIFSMSFRFGIYFVRRPSRMHIVFSIPGDGNATRKSFHPPPSPRLETDNFDWVILARKKISYTFPAPSRTARGQGERHEGNARTPPSRRAQH